MWIGDVDVPEALLDAAEVGRLVVFVGAGASRAEPSLLPDFADLVRTIGARVGHVPTDDEARYHPDVFLGRLEDSGVDVHQLVSAAISKPGSEPNSLHRAIVALAASCRTPMIVTTNYDRHLTSAAEAQGHRFQVYEAPALPTGDDFDGIVHLHGSLSQPSRRLVVTDGDFGKAYLRDAWAARFLERMFAAFTVVFIGYSHGDVVMQYLARSLGPDQRRYVLTDDSQNAEWRRLGLTAVSYPNDAGDHSSLPVALGHWADLATMGQIEHRARIATLVSVAPPTIPEEFSYLQRALSHPERVRYFAEKARFADADLSQRWFAWVQDSPAFSDLFSQRASAEPAARVLMSWIADQYILNQSNSGAALRAFREKVWPPDTWFAITQAFFAHDGELPTWLGPWLQLVLQNAPTYHQDLLDMLLASKSWAENLDFAIMLFEDRTRPYPKQALDFGTHGGFPRFEVDLRGDAHWLAESWTKTFGPALKDHLDQLLSMVSEQLARVYRSLRGLLPDQSFDPIAFRRSAIEPHEQDTHREPIDVLIDAARECIEFALSSDPAGAQRYLDAWLASSAGVLRRLAVHGWRFRADIGSDEKLSWLHSQRLLWDVPLQHEVFRLIQDALPSASEAITQGLIEDVLEGPPRAEDDEHSAYRIYNLLGWMTDSAPDLAVVKAAFEDAQEEHPQYGRREHPDLNHYGSSGFVQDALPFTAAELHNMVVEDPINALAQLRAYFTARHLLEGPTWDGALRSLQACVTAYPMDGIRIAHALQPDDGDIRASLIRGWDGAAVEGVLIEQVLATITGWDHDEIRRPTCAMLSDGGQPDHPTVWHAVEQARQLASALWPTSDVDGAIVGGSDLVIEAINHPAGDLAEFWTKVVQWEWSRNESSWNGIPEKVTTEIDRLISAEGRNGLLARTFLASQLHFFFGADREWCETRMLPLFDWAVSPGGALSAWQGFLTWGRWNDALLNAGLLTGYIEATVHANELPSDLRGQLARHLTSIAMYAAAAPASWLTRFILEAEEELRVSWAGEVRFALMELDPGAEMGQWDRWIREYWSGRVQSVPRPFTPAEASVTAGWVLGLAGVRTSAIDLVVASRAALDQHDGLLYRLDEMDVTADASDWARFLTHLLHNTSQPTWSIAYHLKGIVPRLRAGTPSPDLTSLINEAMRLGATDAADW